MYVHSTIFDTETPTDNSKQSLPDLIIVSAARMLSCCFSLFAGSEV